MSKKLFPLILLALFLVLPAASGRGTTGKPLTLADPYILEYEGRFYAYGTSARDGIAVYTGKIPGAGIPSGRRKSTVSADGS